MKNFKLSVHEGIKTSAVENGTFYLNVYSCNVSISSYYTTCLLVKHYENMTVAVA